LLAHPSLGGTVLLRFRIDPSGNIWSSVIEGFDATVTGCVARVINHIAFSAPPHGAPATVSYSFTFRPAGLRGPVQRPGLVRGALIELDQHAPRAARRR
jgi:hypothetical protein